MRSRPEQNGREIPTTKNRSSVCVYRVPPGLAGISPKAIQPEIVSIGPYHRGKKEFSEFQSYKWWFLDHLLWRTKRDLQDYVKAMSRLEKSARSCYSDHHELNTRDCYLSKQFRDVEAYDSSHWATFMGTYFRKPWSFISVLYAFILLVVIGGQSAVAIMSYINNKRT